MSSIPIPTKTSCYNASASYVGSLGSSYSDHFPSSDIKYSFPKNQIKVLLLENIHKNAIKMFEDETFSVHSLAQALSEEELIEKIPEYHILGIRSKTKVTKNVLEAASKLLAIGCFCIGTDQVDLHTAELKGIPVFNAPFANTRSVAELVICEIIALSRNLVDRASEMHNGIWKKSAVGCVEVRGKSLGIIGYGHIGSQVSVLAESMGLYVSFYDIVPKLPLGNARQVDKIEDILKNCDYVSIHVPKAESTNNMIGKEQFDLMQPHAVFINAARGTVVDIDALADALRSQKIRGAAVDVFPTEPEANGPFKSVLQGLSNVIMTPHVAGSTSEAQAMIGTEVGSVLIRYINQGCTLNSVNFPNLELNFSRDAHRILNVHYNKPGVLKAVNSLFASLDTNVHAQILGTTTDIGYLIVDIDKETSLETKKALAEMNFSIKTRILY